MTNAIDRIYNARDARSKVALEVGLDRFLPMIRKSIDERDQYFLEYRIGNVLEGTSEENPKSFEDIVSVLEKMPCVAGMYPQLLIRDRRPAPDLEAAEALRLIAFYQLDVLFNKGRIGMEAPDGQLSYWLK